MHGVGAVGASGELHTSRHIFKGFQVRRSLGEKEEPRSETVVMLAVSRKDYQRSSYHGSCKNDGISTMFETYRENDAEETTRQLVSRHAPTEGERG